MGRVCATGKGDGNVVGVFAVANVLSEIVY